MRHGGVQFRQHPRAGAVLAEEVLEAARPVRRTDAGGSVGAAVVVCEHAIGNRTQRVVVVQHVHRFQARCAGVVRERAVEVAEILMREDVGHDDVPDLNRIQRDADDHRHARIIRRAVGNVLRQRNAVDDFIAVAIHRAVRDVAENGEEVVFRRQLVLGLHPDVINLAGLGVGVHHKFHAAAAQRRAVEHAAGRHRAVEAVGNRQRRKHQQIGIRRHIQVNVRLRPRGVGRRVGEDAHARHRKRRRQKRRKSGVGGDADGSVAADHAIVGHDVKMPLVGHAQNIHAGGAPNGVGAEGNRVGGDQRRGRADELVHVRLVRQRYVGDVLVAGRIGDDAGVRDRERSRRGADAADDQRVILHDIRREHARRIGVIVTVRLRGDGVHVHAPAEDRDGVVGAQIRRNDDALDIVDRIRHDRVRGAFRRVEKGARRNVVAVINDLVRRVVQVGHDEFEIVDELDGGGGIARRIRPRDRDAQRLRVAFDRDEERVAVAGGQRVGRTLVLDENGGWSRAAEHGRAVRRQRIGQIDQAPALVVDRAVDLQIIRAGGPRAVDEHRLEQRRAGIGHRAVIDEKVLQQRQHARHVRRRHAGAGLEAVIRPQ